MALVQIPQPSSSLAIGSSRVDTSQSMTANTFSDLATVQSVTMTTGTSVVISLGAIVSSTTIQNNYIGVDVTGASTRSAADSDCNAYTIVGSNYPNSVSSVLYLTGLTAGSNTFTLKFRNSLSGNTITYANRYMFIQNLN